MRGWPALPLALLALLSSPGCGRPPVRGNGSNLLLITIETTRADHLSTYGYERDTSPVLTALARRGVLFERASAVSPRTNPSLASVMTSRYPHEHGVRNLLLPLEPEQSTLAELLREAGYVTGAVQTHPRLVAPSGFAQGFDTYHDDYRAHPLAAQAGALAADWIREAAAGERPWFLWLHLMDPHWTYDPPRPWRTRYGADDPRPGEIYRALAERRTRIGPMIFNNSMPDDLIRSFVDFYDAEIRYTDEMLGALLAVVEELGLTERTVIAVTADHGEAFGEHDYYFEHGDFGTEAEIHVPLLLVAENRVPAGARIGASVSTLDLAPSLLDLLDLIDEREVFRGSTLVPLARGEEHDDRACFGETGKRFHPENTRRQVDGVEGKWRWLRRGDLKLMRIPTPDSVDYRLYDLADDPGETRDARHRFADEFERLRAELDAWTAEDSGEVRDYHVTDEVREELRSLGYLD